MRPSVTASLLVATLLTGACGAKWPHHVATTTSTELGRSQVRSIDILPVDLEVWNHPDLESDPDKARLTAEARLVGTVSETFFRRGYTVGAVLDWEGRYVAPDGTPAAALSAPQVLATVDALASYGTIVGNSRELPAPILPARLGSTGSDATLYLGGWGFAGKAPDHGKTAGKILLGAVLIVGVIVVIAALSKSKGDPVGRAAGAVARTATQVGASIGRTALRAGTALVDIGRAVQVDALIDPAIEVAVAAPEVIAEIPKRPVWSNDKSLPRTGRSKMYLEMTLVDNRSGRVLWHAHQAFPADPGKPDEVMRAAKQLLASLPPS